MCATNTRRFLPRSREVLAHVAPAASMSDYQRETEFLRQCLLSDDTAEHRKLEGSIVPLQRHERCVRRAVGRIVLWAVFAMFGLGYSVIFQADQFERISHLAVPLITQAVCILVLGALICLVWFVGLGLANRREECRLWVAKFLEVRLGKPVSSRGDIHTLSDRGPIDGSAWGVEAGNGSPAILESVIRARYSAWRVSVLLGALLSSNRPPPELSTQCLQPLAVGLHPMANNQARA